MAKKIEKTKKGLYIYCVATKKELNKLQDVEKQGGSIIPTFMDIEKCSDDYISAVGRDVFIKLKEATYPSKNKL